MYGCRKCFKETKNLNLGWVKRFFACVPSGADYWGRKIDFACLRSYDGWAHSFLKIEGHALLAMVLPALLLVFVTYGPTCGWRGWPAFGLLVISLACLYAGARIFGEKRLMVSQLVVISLTAIVVWWVAGSEAYEFDKKIYRNLILMMIVPYLWAPLALGKVLSRCILFRKFRNETRFRRFLPHVRMLPRPPKVPEFSYGLIVHSFVHAPLRYPLQLLFAPAFILLFIPISVRVGWLSAGLALATWIALTFASLHDRFNSILPIVKRAFFTGGSLIVSLVIIVLGAGRVAEVSYIQTVVESSSWDTLLIYIFAFYVFFWFVEYWLNRLLSQRLMVLLRSPKDPVGQANYDLDPADPVSRNTKVKPDGRKIQIHGGARLMAIGQLKENQQQEIFQSYERRDLFQRIMEQAALNELTKKNARTEEARALPSEISRRIRSYFSTVNIYLIAVTVSLGLFLHTRPQKSQVVVSHRKEVGCMVNLPKKIWQMSEHGRVILLAASGGGTRAALYTQSVLRGLHSKGALKDLMLASGVSGGGVALAYFAARRDELIKDSEGAAWDRFACDMTYHFIWDVLEGAAEWRITSGTRLGQLLSESFGRVFYGDKYRLVESAKDDDGICNMEGTFGKADEFALILNTALAGHLQCDACVQAKDFPKAATKHRDQTDGSLAGGRLIFTNLLDASVFSSEPTIQGLRLPYVVIQDPTVPLNVAGALTANFPPVFSNAAVDVDSKDRYWVTDGGATDNRGLISLLLWLEDAVADLPKKSESETWPDIYVVMADASADSTKYTQDRGISTLFGAPEKIANKLIDRLWSSIKKTYEYKGGNIEFFDLKMPEIFRIDGGLGTHWMLPRTVKMRIPQADDSPSSPRELELDTIAVRQLINDLHQPYRPDFGSDIPLCYHEEERVFGKSPKGRDNLEDIWKWIKKSKHQEVWGDMLAVLDQQLNGKTGADIKP